MTSYHIFGKHLESIRAFTKKSHWDTALRVVRYMKNSPGRDLLFFANSFLELKAYCDANWASCPMTRRFTSRYCVFIGDSRVFWKTSKQKAVSRSSTEAEYISIAATTCELTWLSCLFKDQQIQLKPMTLFRDNQTTLHIATNLVCHECRKHIELRA